MRVAVRPEVDVALHANVWVPPNDRARPEHLCRYLLRPPLVQDRLWLRADGRVALKLKGPGARASGDLASAG